MCVCACVCVLMKNEFIYIFCISAKSFINFRGELDVCLVQ
jgi:hypothetical protein